MSLLEPKSADECVYFTNRNIGNVKVRAWVLRNKCPQCGKGLMGKPRDPKTGKIKIRALEYVCSECHFSLEEEKYENSLNISIRYTCPHCNNMGEVEIPFHRKKVRIFDEKEQKKKTVELVRFQCEKCGKNIDITKKMK